jgi:hypothetical protein
MIAGFDDTPAVFGPVPIDYTDRGPALELQVIDEPDGTRLAELGLYLFTAAQLGQLRRELDRAADLMNIVAVAR